jgi:hypothetical protein
MTAAPFNIVAIRMSWPGQSTNETFRTQTYCPPQLGRSHGNLSGVLEPADLYEKNKNTYLWWEFHILYKPVTMWARTLGIRTTKNFSVGITQFDCDISLKFIFEFDRMHSRNCLFRKFIFFKF